MTSKSQTPRLQVTAISGGVTVPSSRYRIDALLARLEQQGWRTHSIHGYGPLDRKITNPVARKVYRTACRAKRALVTSSLRVDHPVILQRLAIPNCGYPEALLTRHHDQVVFDFDDAVFLNPQLRECKRRRNALNSVFARVRHVVAGNAWLANHVKGNSNVTIIPTCLDTDVYVPRPTSPQESKSSVPAPPLRIGWIGTSTNFRYLEQLAPALERLRSEHSNIEFAICSDVHDVAFFERLQARFVPWSAAAELEILQSFDIGIMPLADQDWCRGKCAFKLIQYLAVGIPSVCSPYGMNNEIVMEGVNGMFAHQSNWLDPLRTLVEDAALRQRMGRAARETAVEQFSLEIAAKKYDQLLRELL